MKLAEAFRALDALNEDTFSVSDDGINKLAEFEDNDDLVDELAVIDLDAETEDDFQESYVGKVILDCCVCHSKLYKDKEEVEIDDESDLANVGEDCPYCYTSDGFKVIGEVAEFNTESDEDEETDDVEDVEEPKAGEDTTSQMDQVNEGLFDKFKKNSEEDKKSDNYDNYYVIVVNDKGKYRYTRIDPSRSKAELRKAIEGMPTDTLPKDCKYEIIRYGEAKELVGKEFMNAWGKPFHEGLFGIKTKKEKEKEAKAKAEKERQKQRDKELKDQEERARQQSVADSWARNDRAKRDAQTEYNRSRTGSQGSKVSNTGKAGVYYSGGDYYSEDLEEGFKIVDRKTGFTIDDGFTTERDALDAIEDKYQSEIGRYKVIKESVNNVNVETDEDIINVATDDDGKVTVTTEPNNKVDDTMGEGSEMVVPVSDETEAELTGSEEELTDDTEETIEDSGDEVDVEIDDFDEESFNELGEQYFREAYSNVETFRTINVSENETGLVVEGVVKFTTGNDKKTSFILECKTIDKTNKVKFLGENKELKNGKGAYTINGKITDKKLVMESLTYNYSIKDTEGKVSRISGTVKRG